MSQHDSPVQQLVRRVQTGDREALGRLLEIHRPFLKIVARGQLSPALAARVDESDLVQQTCLAVHKGIDQFRGQSSGEFIAWLKVIHERTLGNAVRDHVAAQRRALGREERLDDAAGDALPPAGWTDDRPSRRVMEDERAVQLAAALDRLPPDQCEAIRLRHLEGCTLAELAQAMERSEAAVAGLLKRGMKTLREYLSSTE